jgi:4-amino-4-deoxy-L-arabinose transferase-like glycosyltransferase
MTTLVGALATAYLGFTALHQHRELFPKIHDEGMYLLQARMLAHGRLWMPAHPLADFFETFHVQVHGVYSSIYFPGTALAYAIGIWLRIPPWIEAVAISGAAVALLYRVTAELTDGGLALLAALLLVSLVRFRHLSIMVMSHTLVLALGLAMVWAYLRWRTERRTRWAVVLGALAGWAAITRPIDALCFALPIGLAMLLDLRGAPLRSILTTAACLLFAATPFVTMQLVMDYGVTGHVLQTPATAYARQYWPHLYTWSDAHGDPSARPPTSLQQIQDYYDQFILRPAREQAGRGILAVTLAQRVPMVLSQTLPSLLLVVLLPVGLLRLAGRRRFVLWATLPLVLAGYTTFIFFQKHYAVVVAPAVILGVVLAIAALRQAWGPRGFVGAFAPLAVALLAFWALPEFAGGKDDPEGHPTLADVERQLATIHDPQAAVLFLYRTGDNFREEPVYNTQTPWPDDARIIRAHDLGQVRDRAIFDYYARRQPGRVFYRYDRRDHTLVRLGTAAELTAATPPSTSLP